MKNLLLTVIAILSIAVPRASAKDLVAYFSDEGHTKAVAERIAELTGADIYRIEAAEPYADNPYDDSDRIQDEAYNDLRPAVANAPSQEWLNQYDRIFIGSPCWWHQPAMVLCTFLENYDLSKQPAKSVYLFSMIYGTDNRRLNKKLILSYPVSVKIR